MELHAFNNYFSSLPSSLVSRCEFLGFLMAEEELLIEARSRKGAFLSRQEVIRSSSPAKVELGTDIIARGQEIFSRDTHIF